MTAITKEYDPEIRHFTDAMRYKLHVNRKKGKWEGAKLDDLFDLLMKEVHELREAVNHGNQVAIVLEAADIGNFAMMIANVAMKIATGQNNASPLRSNIINSDEDRLKDIPMGYVGTRDGFKTLDELRNQQAPNLSAWPEEIKAAMKLGV